VLVRQDEEKALYGATELKRRMLAWSALLGLVLALVAALLARRLAWPMTQLGQAIERVTEATASDKDLPQIPQIRGFHEADMLSRTMRNLVA
ncbi:GGDEF domain-containing protein, partial [Acinetobacter baumannii]|nr:GGDEF domain-containing protein [Acinetobacter baumannii]